MTRFEPVMLHPYDPHPAALDQPACPCELHEGSTVCRTGTVNNRTLVGQRTDRYRIDATGQYTAGRTSRTCRARLGSRRLVDFANDW